MSEWIDITKKKPPNEIVWVFILGRMESDGERDSEIIKMINNNGEFRTLDYARAIYLGGEILADFDQIIAWMPLSKMSLPNVFAERKHE